jgi:hypothetical protein
MQFMKVTKSIGAATASLLFVVAPTGVQSQNAQGTSTTTCTQSGNSLTCATTTTVALPSGVNLQSQTSGASFTLTGNSNPNVPSCSALNATPNPVTAANTDVGLAAICVAGTYDYFWNGSSTPSPSSSFTVTAPFANSTAAQTFSVAVCSSGVIPSSGNCANLARQVTFSLPVAPSGCSVSPSSSTAAAGASVTLTASCSSGNPTGFAWTKDGQAVSGSGSQISNIAFAAGSTSPSTTTYAVIASNGVGSAPAVSTTVNRALGGGINYCGSGALTNYIMSMGAAATIDTSGQAGTTEVSIALQVPSTTTTAGRTTGYPNISFVETPSGVADIKEVTISRNRCDFTNPEFWIARAADQASTSRSRIYLNDPNRTGFGLLKIDSSSVWYLNIRNLTCQGVCNTRVGYTGP